MGYETKIFVVEVYDFTGKDGRPKFGDVMASMDLCKCGYSGPVPDLFEQDRKNPEFDFALYAFNPDRQHEAVEVLREIAEQVPIDVAGHNQESLKKLSNDIEDGCITKDCYGDKLGVTKVPDLIAALEQEIQNAKDKGDTPYRRYEWALAMLKGIWDGFHESGREDLRVISYGH